MQNRFGEVVGVRDQVARRLRAVDHALVEALSQSREMIRVEVRKEVGVGPRSAEIVLLEERVLSIKEARDGTHLDRKLLVEGFLLLRLLSLHRYWRLLCDIEGRRSCRLFCNGAPFLREVLRNRLFARLFCFLS